VVAAGVAEEEEEVPHLEEGEVKEVG